MLDRQLVHECEPRSDANQGDDQDGNDFGSGDGHADRAFAGKYDAGNDPGRFGLVKDSLC